MSSFASLRNFTLCLNDSSNIIILIDFSDPTKIGASNIVLVEDDNYAIISYPRTILVVNITNSNLTLVKKWNFLNDSFVLNIGLTKT